jgi:hypothetical protein
MQELLYELCLHPSLPAEMKIEAAECLLMYEEYEEDEEYEEGDKGEEGEDIEKLTDDELSFIKANNEMLRERNKRRQKQGYDAVAHVCTDLSGSPTPRKVELICKLMYCPEYRENANTYFKTLISDMAINCEYRYKSILTLERREIEDHIYFLREASLSFIENGENDVHLRLLAGQSLLQNCELVPDISIQVQNIVLRISQDKSIAYNTRADAADVLLRLGNDAVKDGANSVIEELSRVDGIVRTIFDNAQNVHTTGVEESLNEVLQFLSELPMHNVARDTPLTFEHVRGYISVILKEDAGRKECECKKRHCSHCGECMIKDRKKEKKERKEKKEKKERKEKKENEEDTDMYCKEECLLQSGRHKKVRIGLNRVYMDRALYSNMHLSLVKILLKVWSYITGHECEKEMKLRLLEELEEMAGTCSSGYATRLANVLSGFCDYCIRISWEDGVVGSFTGRLNAMARKIEDISSPFYNHHAHDVVDLWLNAHPDVRDTIQDKLYEELAERAKRQKTRQDNVTSKQVVREYLKTDKQTKVKECVAEFAENAINEMTITTSDWENRQHFMLFFRVSLLSIREELAEEYKEFVSDEQFDLYFRTAISRYEQCC